VTRSDQPSETLHDSRGSPVGPGESRALDMLREEAREALSDLDEFDRVMVTATKP
jgi:hypothetical protein